MGWGCLVLAWANVGVSFRELGWNSDPRSKKFWSIIIPVLEKLTGFAQCDECRIGELNGWRLFVVISRNELLCTPSSCTHCLYPLADVRSIQEGSTSQSDTVWTAPSPAGASLGPGDWGCWYFPDENSLFTRQMSFRKIPHVLALTYFMHKDKIAQEDKITRNIHDKRKIVSRQHPLVICQFYYAIIHRSHDKYWSPYPGNREIGKIIWHRRFISPSFSKSRD